MSSLFVVTNVVLPVVENPDPQTQTVIQFEPPKLAPFMTDGGDVNLLCGNCGFMIAEKLASASQIQAVVISCPRCKAYNNTRT